MEVFLKVEKRSSKKEVGIWIWEQIERKKEILTVAKTFGFQSFAEENETQVWSNNEN